MIRYTVFILLFSCLISSSILLPELNAQSPTGTLLDRNGEVMRGTPLVITGNTEVRDISNSFAIDLATLVGMKERGLNTVRLCLVDPYYEAQTSYSFWTLEEQLPLIDTVVENATALGMNVILNYHSVGEFNRKRKPDFSLAFEYWETLAPRYADNELVFYELINEPTFQSGDYLRAKFKSQLTTLYQRVRELAPQRQILMFSFSSLTHDMESIVNAYSADIDWAFTSVAWHAYGANETSLGKVNELMQQHRMICTEWDYPETYEYVPGELDSFGVHAGAMENIGSGWIDWRDWDDASFATFDSILVPDAMQRGYDWLGDDSGGGGDDPGGGDTDPPADIVMLVQDIELTTRFRGRSLQASSSVLVVDENGNAVAGARVTVAWSSPLPLEVDGIANASGIVEFHNSGRLSKKSSGSLSFSVLNVELGEATYDANLNVETSVSSGY